MVIDLDRAENVPMVKVMLRRAHIGTFAGDRYLRGQADPYGPVRRGRMMQVRRPGEQRVYTLLFTKTMRDIRAGIRRALLLSDTIRHNPTISDITRLSQRVFIEGMRDRFTRDSALAGFPRLWELDTSFPVTQL